MCRDLKLSFNIVVGVDGFGRHTGTGRHVGTGIRHGTRRTGGGFLGRPRTTRSHGPRATGGGFFRRTTRGPRTTRGGFFRRTTASPTRAPKGASPPGLPHVDASDNANAKKLTGESKTGTPKHLTDEEKKKVEDKWTKPQPEFNKPEHTPEEKQKKDGFFSKLKSDGCGMDCLLEGASLALQAGEFVKFGLEQMFENDRMQAERDQYEKQRLDAIRDQQVYSDNGNTPDGGWYQAKHT